MARCACGKVKHPTAALAAVHRDELIAKRDEHPKRARRLTVYQCSTGAWHVGHRRLPRKYVHRH